MIRDKAFQIWNNHNRLLHLKKNIHLEKLPEGDREMAWEPTEAGPR